MRAVAARHSPSSSDSSACVSPKERLQKIAKCFKRCFTCFSHVSISGGTSHCKRLIEKCWRAQNSLSDHRRQSSSKQPTVSAKVMQSAFVVLLPLATRKFCFHRPGNRHFALRTWTECKFRETERNTAKKQTENLEDSVLRFSQPPIYRQIRSCIKQQPKVGGTSSLDK